MSVLTEFQPAMDMQSTVILTAIVYRGRDGLHGSKHPRAAGV